MTGRCFLPARAVLFAFALSLLGTAAAVPSSHASPRIVNGVETQRRPTTGALLMNFDGFLGGICSGTLVGCRHFVTAAHCVCAGGNAATCGTPDPARFRVFLQHAGVLDVRAIAVAPTYSFGTAGDVAVLTLSAAVTGIHPTPLNATANPGVGMTGTIAGFGISGGANDFGILREGSVAVASCGAVASEPAHVCWIFDDLVGAPGTDSNVCSGDSGGSLLVDFAGRSVLAGVTSGGLSIDCLPLDVSFASNVLQNRPYIEAIAGIDLASASCGSITQVGDAGTHTTEVSFHGPSREELACRGFVAKAYTTYTNAKLKIMRRCIDGVNEGFLAGPCPDAAAVADVAKVTDTLRFLGTTGSKCTPAVVSAIGAANGCAGARDSSDLQRCILTAASAAADDLLDAEYADTNRRGSIADVGARLCQAAITDTMSKYAIRRLRLLVRCQTAADRGKVMGCPDAATVTKIAKKAARSQAAIAARCTDAQVVALNGAGVFGGGCGSTARSAAALARCETVQHDAETDALFALLDGMAVRRQTSVSVPPGTARLRAVLNGVDTGATDLDLYVKRGVPATETVFDARSINGGVYESIDLVSPASGSWYVLVNPVAGRNVRYQLTITAFGP